MRSVGDTLDAGQVRTLLLALILLVAVGGGLVVSRPVPVGDLPCRPAWAETFGTAPVRGPDGDTWACRDAAVARFRVVASAVGGAWVTLLVVGALVGRGHPTDDSGERLLASTPDHR